MYAESSTEKLIEKATRLTLDTEWPELGRILNVLQHRLRTKHFVHVRTACEISERTAFYLMSIVRRTDGRGIDLPEGLPWRKVAVIAPLMGKLATDQECVALLRQVPLMTHEELTALAKGKAAGEGTRRKKEKTT